MASPAKRSRVRVALLLVLAWTAEFALLEAALRLCGFGPERRPEVREQFDKFRPDEALTWALKPSWSGTELNGAPVRTNALGLRGPEPAAARPAERLLFLGDSVVYGHFLPEEETIPSRLEALLRDAGEPATEVLNAGVPGYGTFQEERYYRERGRALAPTRVLLGFCLNDVVERYTSDAAWGGARFFMGNVDTSVGLNPLVRLWQSTAMRDALAKLLRSSARRSEAYRLTSLWTAQDSERIRAAWDTVFGELDRLAADVASDGIPFDVVLFPVASQVGGEGRSRAPQDLLMAHLEERGIHHLDLLEPLLEKKKEKDELFVDATHFTPIGSRIAAGQIRRYLADAHAAGR